MKHVSVIGAGAWGTALAIAVCRAGLRASLWSPNLNKVESINQHRENIFRLPGVQLTSIIQAITKPEETVSSDVIILTPPAQNMRQVCETFQNLWPPSTPLVIASKGIENESMLLMSEVVQDIFPLNPILILSGPSFAIEVAKKLPTALSLAADNILLAQEIAQLLSSPYFRIYASDDMIGTQVGGACKNIIAIACGIVEGLRLGDNARAALVTRGLAEITRLGCKLGARSETFLGLSGVGDMILTCLSSQSRNQAFGFSLGQGVSLDDLLSNKKTLVEGVHTVKAATDLAQKHNVEMPITFEIHNLLNHKGSIETVIDHLLTRSLKIERT